MVARSDHVMYQQMMIAPPAAQTVERADPSVRARLLLHLIFNISSGESKGGGGLQRRSAPGGILSFSCSFLRKILDPPLIRVMAMYSLTHQMKSTLIENVVTLS